MCHQGIVLVAAELHPVILRVQCLSRQHQVTAITSLQVICCSRVAVWLEELSVVQPLRYVAVHHAEFNRPSHPWRQALLGSLGE